MLKVIAIGFSLLFLLAALHKFSSLSHFRAILQDYQLLPVVFIAPLTIVIPLCEAAIGACWLLLADPAPVALASMLMLGLYTVAIVINLSRGRVHISCGCGIAGSDEGDQHLTSGLVWRNVTLIVLALIGSLPVARRSFGLVDYATLIAAIPATVLLYVAGNQLLANSGAIGTWRDNDD